MGKSNKVLQSVAAALGEEIGAEFRNYLYGKGFDGIFEGLGLSGEEANDDLSTLADTVLAVAMEGHLRQRRMAILAERSRWFGYFSPMLAMRKIKDGDTGAAHSKEVSKAFYSDDPWRLTQLGQEAMASLDTIRIMLKGLDVTYWRGYRKQLTDGGVDLVQFTQSVSILVQEVVSVVGMIQSVLTHLNQGINIYLGAPVTAKTDLLEVNQYYTWCISQCVHFRRHLSLELNATFLDVMQLGAQICRIKGKDGNPEVGVVTDLSFPPMPNPEYLGAFACTATHFRVQNAQSGAVICAGDAERKTVLANSPGPDQVVYFDASHMKYGFRIVLRPSQYLMNKHNLTGPSIVLLCPVLVGDLFNAIDRQLLLQGTADPVGVGSDFVYLIPDNTFDNFVPPDSGESWTLTQVDDSMVQLIPHYEEEANEETLYFRIRYRIYPKNGGKADKPSTWTCLEDYNGYGNNLIYAPPNEQEKKQLWKITPPEQQHELKACANCSELFVDFLNEDSLKCAGGVHHNSKGGVGHVSFSPLALKGVKFPLVGSDDWNKSEWRVCSVCGALFAPNEPVGNVCFNNKPHVPLTHKTATNIQGNNPVAVTLWQVPEGYPGALEACKHCGALVISAGGADTHCFANTNGGNHEVNLSQPWFIRPPKAPDSQ